MRDLPQGGGAWEGRLGGNSYSRRRSPFPWGVGPSSYVLSSCLIIPNFHKSCYPIKTQLLDPLFTNSLYWVCWAQIPIYRWAQPKNRDLTIGAVCGESCLCDDECNNLLRQDQVLQGRIWWPIYCTIRGELQAVYSLTGLWHHVRGLRPHQGSDPRKSSGWPRWALIEGSGGRTKQFKGASRWDQFQKIGTDIF